MLEINISLVLFLCGLCFGSSTSLVSSCTGREDHSWNSKMVAARLEAWIRSGVTVAQENKVGSMLFHPHTKQFSQHFTHQNDKHVEDLANEFISLEELDSSNNLMGMEDLLHDYIAYKEGNLNASLKYQRNDYEEYDDVPGNKAEYDSDYKYENYEYFNENDRSVVTIAEFIDGKPTGIAWQWKSRRFEDGFLYGHVDDRGMFTGDNITFIYPDLRSGITGKFFNGKLMAGVEVEITGEKCSGGIKEISFRTVEKRKEIVWKKENMNDTYIGMHPTVRDPFERRSTYIGESALPGSGEGIFAKRYFLPGKLVSYFSGLKVKQSQIFPPGMNKAEKEIAGSYYFGFGAFPGFPEHLCIDIPPRYRHVKDYRTTLGHKVNHNLAGINTEFGFVRHPSLGPVVALIAIEPIAKDKEIFVSYNYDLKSAPQWYKDHEKLVNG